MTVKVNPIPVGPMGNISYMVEKDGCAIFIDPAWDIETIEKNLGSLKLSAVFFTHGHFDHVHSMDDFLAKHKMRAYIEARDAQLAALPAKMLLPYDAPARFDIDGINVEIIHTPGHTEGGVCIKIDNNLFTGDTLFVGACGRVDLLQSDPRKMRESLYKLSLLSPDTKVYTGHDYNGFETTIAEQIKTNHFMKSAIKDYSK